MKRAIGFFDSGVGGISVLKSAVKALPNENFIYLGDTKNAPYGVRSEENIRALTVNCVNKLLERNIKALVIACNTATSAAAQTLRETLTIPVIAMEPALKPAHENRHGGQIIVLATAATLRQQKFRLLMEKYGEGAVLIPGNGIVELVESGVFEGEEARKCLNGLLDEALKQKTDSIVLGCTHYSFMRKEIENVVGKDVLVLDSIDGTVRQLKRVLEREGLLEKDDSQGSVEFISTAGKEAEKYMQRMFEL